MSVEVGVSSDGVGGGWRHVDESGLIAEMRRGRSAAFAEVYRRFAPLLARMARRRKVPDADRETLIMDYLEDTLMPVLRGWRSAPSPLGAYLAAGFRRRLVSAWRTRQAEEKRVQSLEVTASDPRERVVAEGLSEYAFRLAAGPDGSSASNSRPNHNCDDLPYPLGETGADRTREARAGLARALANAMNPDERQLMGHLAERLPQREIASIVGIAPTAARVRIHRLRERLMQVAVSYIAALPVQEGILLTQFLDIPRAHRVNGVRAQKRDDKRNGDEIV